MYVKIKYNILGIISIVLCVWFIQCICRMESFNDAHIWEISGLDRKNINNVHALYHNFMVILPWFHGTAIRLESELYYAKVIKTHCIWYPERSIHSNRISHVIISEHLLWISTYERIYVIRRIIIVFLYMYI